VSEVKLTIIDRDGETHRVSTETGGMLMHVLRDNVDLDIGICGGEISCGTCLVQLNSEFAARIATAGEDEAEMLDALGAQGNARLACQIVLDDAVDGLQATILQED
jgi:ferredoxin, 2Fe-2S